MTVWDIFEKTGQFVQKSVPVENPILRRNLNFCSLSPALLTRYFFVVIERSHLNNKYIIEYCDRNVKIEAT